MPKNSKPRKKYRPRSTLTTRPTLAEVEIIFRPLAAMLSRLRAGEVLVAKETPVLKDWHGDHCAVAPAIQGWCECFERICAGEHIAASWGGLRALAIAIRDDAEITSAAIDLAEKELDSGRAIILSLSRECIGSYMRTEMIAIEQETIGAAPRRTLDDAARPAA